MAWDVTVIVDINRLGDSISKPGRGYLNFMFSYTLRNSKSPIILTQSYGAILGKAGLFNLCKAIDQGKRKLNSNQF